MATNKNIGKSIRNVEKIENSTARGFTGSANRVGGAFNTLLTGRVGQFDLSINKVNLENAIRRSGYFAMVDDLVNNTYQEIIQESFEQYQATQGVAFRFSDSSISKINSLKQQDINQFTQLGDDLITKTNRIMMNHSFGSLSTAQAISDISDEVRKFENFSETWARTTTQGLFSQVNTSLAEDNGIEQFEYFGPIDNITRPFCQDHTGEVRTINEWDELSNGQISPVSIYRGGFNCRHQLIGVGDV